MKIVKRILSAVLCLLLFVQFFPLDALAAGTLVSNAALDQAERLSGLGEDAPTWHEGMKPQSNWNAMELNGWLDHVLQHEHYSVSNAHHDLEHALDELAANSPDAYGRLTSGPYANYVNYMKNTAFGVEDLRQTLRSYRDQSTMHSSEMKGLIDVLREGNLTDREKTRYALRLQASVNEVEGIRNTVVDNYDSWLEQIEAWHQDFTGGNKANCRNGVMSNAAADSLSDWIHEVESYGNEPITANVNVDLYAASNRGTALSKLSGSGSVLSNANQTVTVISDREFYIETRTPNPSNPASLIPVTSGTITVWDAKDGMSPAASSAKTNSIPDSGKTLFNVSDFTVDSNGVLELGVLVKATGYQALMEYKAVIKKGGGYGLTLIKPGTGQSANGGAVKNAGSEPYYVAMTFNDDPMLATRKQVFYSSANDVTHDINVVVAYPNGYSGDKKLTMRYLNKDGKEITTSKNYSDGSDYSAGIDGYSARSFTFSDKWKQIFKPGEKISFKIGDGAWVDSMLTVERGVIDKPLYGKDNAMYTTVSNTISRVGTLLSFDFEGDNLPSFLNHSNLSINIPFLDKYVPKFAFSLDGRVSVAYGLPNFSAGASDDEGSEGSKGKSWYSDHTWKTEDQMKLDQKAQVDEKASVFAKETARMNALMSSAKDKWTTMGTFTVYMTAFVVLQGRIVAKSDSDSGDKGVSYKATELSLTVGVIFGGTGDWTVRYLIGFINVEATLSLTVAVTIPLVWDDVDLHNLGKAFKTAPRLGGGFGLTVLARIQIAVSVGVGVKGVLAAYGMGTLGFNFMFQFTTGDKAAFQISMDFNFRVCVDVFWFKYYIQIFSITKTLVDTLNNASGNAMKLISAKRGVKANDDSIYDGNSELEPKSYPKLVPEAKEEIGGMLYGGGECKFVNFKGYTYAFTIGMEAGVNRLHWMNLTSGTSGSFSTFLNTIKDKEAINEGPQPTFVGAENIISMHDYAFDVIAHTGGMECIQVVACCTSQFENVTVKWEDGKERTFQSPTDTILYFITLRIDDLGYLEVFQDTWSKLYAYGGWKQENKKIGELSAITSGYTSDMWGGRESDFIIAAKEYKVPTSGDDYYERMDVLQYSIRERLMGGNLGVSYSFMSNTDVSEVPTLETSAKRILPEEGYYSGIVTWYAIEKDSTNRGTLVHGCNEARKVKLNALTDKEENVIFYAKRPNEHTLYYLDQQKITGEDGAQVGVRNWLKRADVKLKPYLYKYTWFDYVSDSHTITDFDVQVDADSFYLQEYGGLTYIYWLSTVDKTDEDAPDVYRMMATYYNPSTDSMSEVFVLAELCLPDGLKPSRIYIGENGTGYCSSVFQNGEHMLINLYSFPLNWITSLELKDETICFKDALANPASWVDSVVSVMNTGNTGVTTFDIQLVNEYKSKGKTKTAVVETVHIDLLNSGNNSVSVGNNTIATGSQVAYQLRDAVEPKRKSDHNVVRRKWDHYKGWTNASGNYVQSRFILPGTLKAFTVPLYIPSDWRGDKTVYLRLGSYTTRANWAAANYAAGVAANGGVVSNAVQNALDPNLNPEIVYTRDKDGNMVRTDNVANMLAVANAAGDTEALENSAIRLSPLYPNEIEGGEDLEVKTALNDLDVYHHVYCNLSGEPYVSITVLNFADIDESLDLYAKLYLDDAEEGVDLALPYFEKGVTDSRTQTVDLPLKTLMGDSHPRKARVVIRAKNVEEVALNNNEFVIHFDDADLNDPLRFTRQPTPVTARVGETVQFSVAVAGGTKPYTYKWQVWMGEKKGWVDIPDSDSATLTVEQITEKMHGRKARCVVTDHYLNTITSDEAMLTISGQPLPETGDKTNLPLYIAAALLALALLWWLRRREKAN